MVVLMRCVLALLITVALGGCAGPPPSVDAQDSTLDDRSVVRTTYQAWAGSQFDHQAAAVVHAFVLNGDYAGCMADKDVAYRWEPSISLVPSELDDGTWEAFGPFRLRFPFLARVQ